MEQSITFRELDKHEIGMAMELAWEVFMQFEAPEYSDEGINEFYRSIHDDDYVSRLRVFGALSGNELVGMIATRNEGTHIALFFVKGRTRHRKNAVSDSHEESSFWENDRKFLALCCTGVSPVRLHGYGHRTGGQRS